MGAATQNDDSNEIAYEQIDSSFVQIRISNPCLIRFPLVSSSGRRRRRVVSKKILNLNFRIFHLVNVFVFIFLKINFLLII